MRSVTLGEVCQVNPPGSRLSERTEVAFLGMADVSDDGHFEAHERNYSDVAKGFTAFRRGDVLLAKITPCFENGKATHVENLPLEFGWGSTEFHVLRPGQSIDGRYLFHLVHNSAFRQAGQRRMIGSAGQRRVPADFLEKLPVCLPSIREQRRIADILDRADALKRKRQQALKLADDFLRATFLDMFGDPESNPKRLQTAKLGDLCFIGTGGTPSRADDANYGGAIPWVKTTEVNGTRIFCTEEALTEQGLSLSNCKVFPVDSILIAMYGQGKTRGQVGILGIPASTNQACAVIVPSPKISTSFLFQHLRLDYERLRSVGRGGNQPNMNLSLVRDHEVLVPTSEQQIRFASLVARLSATVRDLEAATADIGRLTTTLTRNLFAPREAGN